jgi:hypothetical protein
MSAIGGPATVTSGLVLELDAGNVKSYQSGSTTWFDKSGNARNGTLTNGPTFNTGSLGSIVFDGVDDYVNCGSGIITTTTITVNSWVRLNTNNNFQHIVDSSANTWHLAVLDTGRAYFWDGNSYHISGSLLNTNTWYMVTGVKTPTTNDLYINGTLNNTINSTSSVSTNTLNIARWQGTSGTPSRYLNGNISLTQVYNRSLSASEVQQNFNATRARFGI